LYVHGGSEQSDELSPPCITSTIVTSAARNAARKDETSNDILRQRWETKMIEASELSLDS
jgi:hypothetical protein